MKSGIQDHRYFGDLICVFSKLFKNLSGEKIPR